MKKLAVIAPTNTPKELLVSSLERRLNVSAKRRTVFDFSEELSFEKVSIFGPALGSPAATVLTEKIIKDGFKKVILFGAVGAIYRKEDSVRIGDVGVANSAISEEGTSVLYGAEKTFPIVFSNLQQLLIERHSKKARTIHSGRIWTTDAPHLESVEKIARFKDKGALFIDMECSAIAYLCQTRNIEFAGFFVISDIQGEKHSSGFASKEFKNSVLASAETISDVCIEDA